VQGPEFNPQEKGCLCDLGLGKYFFNMSPKAQSILKVYIKKIYKRGLAE
jgi:hypothetical protein